MTFESSFMLNNVLTPWQQQSNVVSPRNNTPGGQGYRPKVNVSFNAVNEIESLQSKVAKTTTPAAD